VAEEKMAAGVFVAGEKQIPCFARNGRIIGTTKRREEE
jgi:hypothetical protein